MRYYDSDNKKDKGVALVAVAVYILILATAIFFVEFTSGDKHDPESIPEGILISFGEPDQGEMTTEQNNAPVVESQTEEIEAQPTEPVVEEVVEQDNATDAVIEATNVVVPKKKVNTQALYSANKGKSENKKPSTNNKKGTEGSPLGSPDSNGTSVSLNGRLSIGNIPIPSYTSNKEGRVVIEIQVNKRGEVIKASYRAFNSTTSDSKLVEEAIAAATKSRFNQDNDANFIQVGTITYVFKVR